MAGASGILRWLRQSPNGQVVGSRLGAAYIRLVTATTRWRIEGKDGFDALAKAGEPILAVIWHGRLFMSPTWAPPGRRTVAMISNNRDGDLIAAIVGRFGVDAVRGSTYDKAKGREKGGAQAYTAGLETLRGGSVLAVTPDGPRGPRMRAQNGAAQLAVAAQVPVVPIAFSAERGVLTRSWDRFLLPYPFGKGAQVYGPPMTPPPPGDARALIRFRRELEAALTEVTNRADALCGREAVEPEPLTGGPAAKGPAPSPAE